MKIQRYRRLSGAVCWLLLITAGVCSGQRFGKNDFHALEVSRVPPQPGKEKWYFVDDLKSPFWEKITWSKQHADMNQADLSKGIRLKAMFPDPQNRLESAYADLERFCLASGIGYPDGKFMMETIKDVSLKGEEFRLEVGTDRARIFAGHVDGIRRGIFYVEDEMLIQKGPFLPIGSIHKNPAIVRRISRCFFSPIKRPGNHPGIGDELMDEVDYYPEEYLNRLAHEGVNGLWLTVSSKDGEERSVGFGDLVSTEITPHEGVNGERRLSKLKAIVDKCLQYGINIYIKTMEPHVRFDKDDPMLKKFPDLPGNFIRNQYYLCASGKSGQQYLYEAVNKIFTAIPELGGIVNISHGELYTTCLSALPATGGGTITCPRCSKIPKWEILHNSLSAMRRGMEDAAPKAELISWLYMPQPQAQSAGSANYLADWVYEIPGNTPKGVVLQFNFESGIEKEVFGKKLIGGDYWISAPGPSGRFVKVANSAAAKGTAVSAKIQTGTSYEVSTVPYVPVPSLLYQKFRAMKQLGVSHTMLNWIVGASPGLMNKAAGLLSGNDYADEEAFLKHLASIYWRNEDNEQVIKAWKFFSEGYQSFPMTNLFQYYGPVNDGPVWPLLLYPHDAILAPTYQLGSRNTFQPWAPSGDRIGESFTELLSLKEMTMLCKDMSESWEKGLEILNRLERNYLHDEDRLRDIGIARSLGIQFRSGYNILKFYLLREEMFRREDARRKDILKQLTDIIREEMASSQRLVLLCEKDSRLGFHPDAEGYKFFPEKLKWRIAQLKHVLDVEVPEIAKMIAGKSPLFPEYTGKLLSGKAASATTVSDFKKQQAGNAGFLESATGKRGPDWHAYYDSENLYLRMYEAKEGAARKSEIGRVLVRVESQRLFPARDFWFTPAHMTPFTAGSVKGVEVKIPLEQIDRLKSRATPIRINISAHIGEEVYSWKKVNPIAPRLMLGSYNPADLDWLVFK